MFTSAAVSALYLMSVAHAVPVVKRDASLPASAATQQDIINLENTIVYLTNDIVQTNQANGENDYNSGFSQFQSIASIVAMTDCQSNVPDITNAQDAITSLNTTQNNLMQLSLDLQNAASSQDTINNDYCEALNPFSAVHNFIFNILATPENGASNAKVAATLNEQNYDPNKLGQTEIAAEVALEALISALNNIPAGQPSSSQAKTAYDNVQSAISTYAQAADAAGPHSCPATGIDPATDPKSAINDVYAVERAVQKAYADTTANNGLKLEDFCNIATFLSAINAYVQA